MPKATQFLGLSISKSNWQQRLNIDKLLAGKLHYGSDSWVFKVFDNLGYDRKGGPLKSKRYETVDVSWIAGTTAGAADSSLSQSRRKYSTATKEISADWKVAELVREITMLKAEWHAFKGADGNPVTAPTLPQEWHTDTQKTESYWAQPLTNWTVSNLNKTLKPRLCAMLAEVRAVLVR
jgi:hypothetical protein